MVTTVCMNPAFDKTALVKHLECGAVNRLESIRYDVGGKGLNVAIVLTRLGAEAHCVGCAGEEDAEAFGALLAREGIFFRSFVLPGKIRTNLKVLNKEDGVVTEFNEPGLIMTEAQQEAFFSFLQTKAKKSQYIIFSGSMPQGCPASLYQQYIGKLKNHKCILDASGEALLLGLQSKPFMVKPNLPELEALVGEKLQSLLSIRDAALSLIRLGAQNVVVSLGKDGAILTDGAQSFFSPALPVASHSTVGAGDAMLGGILKGLEAGESLTESFRFGVAAGAASVMTEGTQLVYSDDFEQLLPDVVLEKL